LCSPCGHCRCLLLLQSVFHASTFLPTFPRRGFAFRASRSSSPLQYYAGSDSCPALARQAGLFAYSALPSGHPAPNHVVLPNIALSVTSARPVGFPGFARPSRLAATRRRNGFVILRAIRSPPVALHPASRRRSYLRLHAM
jgi:hypothetical protein